MKGCCLTDWSFKSRVLEIYFFTRIFLLILVCFVPSSIYAKCTQESRESAVKAGINPKVVKILCGDPLEEDYVFEVKPSNKSVIPTRAVDPETNINDSEVEGESTLEPEFVIPEGPPTCDEEKVARMIARGFSDQLIISICGKGVIQEKDKTVYVARVRAMPARIQGCSMLSSKKSAANADRFTVFHLCPGISLPHLPDQFLCPYSYLRNFTFFAIVRLFPGFV